MVRPIKDTSLSTRFRKAEYNRRNMASELDEGDIWMDVLLQQLVPAIEITNSIEPGNSTQNDNLKFNLDAELSRMRFAFENETIL